MNNKKRRLTLAIKLNLMIVALLLIMATGLVTILYRVQCDSIDKIYYEQAERYADIAEDYVGASGIDILIKAVESDEFKAARNRAVVKGDESILKEWLMQQVPNPDVPDITLWTFCESSNTVLNMFRQRLGISYAYVEYFKDGVNHYLLDPSESILQMGTVTEDQPEFAEYAGNVHIPPTVSNGRYGWLYSAAEPVVYNGEAIATVGIDIDMNRIMASRRRFLINSAVLVLLLTATAVGVSLFLIRRLAIRPIKGLADAALDFAADENSCSRDKVLRLDKLRNDEVGDLGREIQSMQTRILDYTENLTRITAEQQRADAEMHMASRIQESMLPDRFPAFPDISSFDIYALMDPAKEVGGDFYDFFMTDENHLTLLIADVSDKGVPAALFMMASKIIIFDQAQFGSTPADILTAVNARICANNRSKMFITVWLGILDLRTGEMTCANAGHEFPVLRSGHDGFKPVRDKHDLVVGALPKAKYRNYTLTLQPGDALFVYTDGVPEATNASGERYGLERTVAALNRLSGHPKPLLTSFKAEIDAFVGGAKQFDDLTMLCMEYYGQDAEAE